MQVHSSLSRQYYISLLTIYQNAKVCQILLKYDLRLI